jgi:hypothetical protein
MVSVLMFYSHFAQLNAITFLFSLFLLVAVNLMCILQNFKITPLFSKDGFPLLKVEPMLAHHS